MANLFIPRDDIKIRKTFTKDIIAGGVSAAISRTSVAPFDRIKLILQTQSLSDKQ